MPYFIDQMNRRVFITDNPKRIVSLVPSQSELLFDLGLTDEVIGITKFCIHPTQWKKNKTKVGGTKNINLDVLANLKPDLIIANKEENEQAQLTEMMKLYPVWISDINTVNDALKMIESIGIITGKGEQATIINNKIAKEFLALEILPFHKKTVAYFIWKEPYMVAANDTFITHILALAGLKNVFENYTFSTPQSSLRYPIVKFKDLINAQPDVIFLSSEPYPFKQKHVAEFKAKCPNSLIKIVDGEMFSWYGSRLIKTPSYLVNLKVETDNFTN
jgi:ABC-type Fe3+-hydroxamate transport system substrate-binding protein